MGLLETNSLTKAFGALVAVDRVNLAVEKDVIHSIIGPNGAGKTTLFNVLAGVYPPSSGLVRYKGKDISSLAPYERCHLGIGRSFQITSIFPHLTVRENVRLAVQSKGRNRLSIFKKASRIMENEEKTTDILEKMGLREFEHYRAATIPYGSQRSLDMAIAIASEPELLLLDEPTSGMTPEDSSKMMDLIKKLSQRYTILLIEHHMHVVMSISDKITVLDQGRVIAEGTPELIKKDEQVRLAYLGGLKA